MPIPAIRTFGFEAEYVTNGSQLAAALQSSGHWSDAFIHSYHCSCDSCEFGTSRSSPLRLQSDSSLGGDGVEVITDVLRSWVVAVPLMEELQDALVNTDVEPGMRAGLHVHVARSSTSQQNATMWQFARMEPALLLLANGPHPEMRTFNLPYRPVVKDAVVCNSDLAEWLHQEPGWVRLTTNWDIEQAPDLVECHQSGYYNHDRHGNLNPFTGGRTPTVEFRLWNSTRSAWRMEMACRVSHLFGSSDPFLARCSSIEVNNRDADEVLVDLVEAIGRTNDRAGELVERQVRFNAQGTFTEVFAA